MSFSHEFPPPQDLSTEPTKRRHVLLRIIVLVGVLALAGGGFLLFHLPQTGSLLLVWKLQRENPRLASVPQPLIEKRIFQGPCRRFSYFGYEFDSPWLETERVDQYSSLARVGFKSGQFIVFLDPKQRVDRIKTMKDTATAKGRDVSDVFGKEAMRSNYELTKAVLNLTPSQLSLFMPAREAIRDSILLVLKGIEIPNTETGLFSFETDRLRGFQKGDPSRAPVVIVNAFDQDDREFEMWIGVHQGRRAEVTQADINRIIRSIRLTEAHQRK